MKEGRGRGREGGEGRGGGGGGGGGGLELKSDGVHHIGIPGSSVTVRRINSGTYQGFSLSRDTF